MVVPFEQFGAFCQGHSRHGTLEKARHVKSEMHIRRLSRTVMQVTREMTLEFRVDVSFRNRPMGDTMMPMWIVLWSWEWKTSVVSGLGRWQRPSPG